MMMSEDMHGLRERGIGGGYRVLLFSRVESGNFLGVFTISVM